jgi:hypothetical protein
MAVAVDTSIFYSDAIRKKTIITTGKMMIALIAIISIIPHFTRFGVHVEPRQALTVMYTTNYIYTTQYSSIISLTNGK